MCEKTCYDGKLANNVIYVKYRISVSDTVKVAQIHAYFGYYQQENCIQLQNCWFFNPKCYYRIDNGLLDARLI